MSTHATWHAPVSERVLLAQADTGEGRLDSDTSLVPSSERKGESGAGTSSAGRAVAGKPAASLSGYVSSDVERNSAKSVDADLIASDRVKPAVFPIDVVQTWLRPFYEFKEDLKDGIGLKFSTDYSVLIQRASSTETGDRTGASHVLRFLGTWLRVGDPARAAGRLVWKTEGRAALGGYPTPRDLGFNTGSALSTANYKELDWGITNLYWRQTFEGGKYGILVGHLDPGDWVDQYPFLNAWTYFLNDAFYNNPTEALPKQGFSMVGQAYLPKEFYLMAGVADANGKGGELDFASFWETREWFTWLEAGFRADRDVNSKDNTHLSFWHQDARPEAGTDESWGLAFTHTRRLNNGAVPFLRAGYARGNAPQLRRFIGVGVSWKLFGRDVVGLATSWGSPPDKSLRDQITSEFFYRLQVTQNLAISPDLQLTFQPAFAPNRDWVAVAGLRFRIAF